MAGPKRQLNFNKSKLFENHYGNASAIVFESRRDATVEGLVYIDQQSGDVIISPTGKHLANKTSYQLYAVLRGRDQSKVRCGRCESLVVLGRGTPSFQGAQTTPAAATPHPELNL